MIIQIVFKSFFQLFKKNHIYSLIFHVHCLFFTEFKENTYNEKNFKKTSKALLVVLYLPFKIQNKP